MTQTEVNWMFFILVMLLFGAVWGYLQYQKSKKEEQMLMMKYLETMNPVNRFRGK